MALSVPIPQAPWRLVPPSRIPVAGVAAWSRSSLPDAVALLLAPWCPRHARWYDPVRCAPCRNLPVHLGLREAEDRVRRVLALEPVWVRKVLSGVAGGLGAWLTGAWSWFTAKGTVLGARSAARVLRATFAPTGQVHTRPVAASGEWCAAWGITEVPRGPSSVDAWESVVVRARLTNQVLRTYFDEGIPDSVHLHVGRLAGEVAERLHPHGEDLYPYLAASLGAVLDCLLVLQLGGSDLDAVRGQMNAAGTGFVRYGNCWILPCLDGSVRFITPDAVRAWHHYADQTRTRSTDHLATLLPGWGVQPKSRAEEEAILGRIDRSAQLRLDEAIDFRNLPEGPDEENHYVEALAYCAQWQRKSP